MWSDWLVFCDCGFSLSALWCPLSAPTILLGFLLPWTWGISSWLLQQGTIATPYLGRVVSPHGCSYWPWTWGISLRCSLTQHCAAAFATPVEVVIPFKKYINFIVPKSILIFHSVMIYNWHTALLACVGPSLSKYSLCLSLLSLLPWKFNLRMFILLVFFFFFLYMAITIYLVHKHFKIL